MRQLLKYQWSIFWAQKRYFSLPSLFENFISRSRYMPIYIPHIFGQLLTLLFIFRLNFSLFLIPLSMFSPKRHRQISPSPEGWRIFSNKQIYRHEKMSDHILSDCRRRSTFLLTGYPSLFTGFNLVFPETLEDRSSVQKLLNHAQYDGGGFRLSAAINYLQTVFVYCGPTQKRCAH
jgi:hypothetical protein